MALADGRVAANRRRIATWIAFFSVVLLTAALFWVPVPYGIFSPGPVCDALAKPTSSCPALNASSLITVSPASADYPSTSKIGATTVNVRNGEPSIGEAIAAWLSADQAVVPREVVIPPGQDQDEVLKQGAADMREAQSSAISAAESALGLLRVTVADVQSGLPAASVLKAGDVIVAVNGTPVHTRPGLLAIVAKTTDPAAPFVFTIERAGVRSDLTIVRAKNPDPKSDGGPIFGFTMGVDTGSLNVDITLDPNAVGGPSAGLMLALSVYDRLTPGNLAGDATVAGTGTIDEAGNIGPIGGIQQKMYAARHSFKATVFLVPAGDCGDVKGAIPKGLRVVKVSTFDDALNAMAAIRAGKVETLPKC